MLHTNCPFDELFRNELVDVLLGWAILLWRMNRKTEGLWVETNISENYVTLSKTSYMF